MSDTQESAADDSSKKNFLRWQNVWKTGEKFPVSFSHTVEGMVVSTTWVDSVLMVVFLSPPFTREEGTWAEAALMYKPATSLVRKAFSHYDYPFPSDPRIVNEVKKANGNVEILQEVVKFLNKKLPSPQLLTDLSKVPTPPKINWSVDEQDPITVDRTIPDHLSLNLLLSQQDEEEHLQSKQSSDKLINRIAEEVSLRLSVSEKKKSTRTKSTQKKYKKKSKVSSSSSSSSSSESGSKSDSSSSDENVGSLENDEGKGWCVCPFSINDIRRTAEPKQKMQGKSEERVILRKALHNIYSEYHTLKSYIEIVRTDSLSSSTKPYNSDLLWLSYHATYLDLLLLHAIEGPWQSWNELVVDALTKSFLELLVRSSTNRLYPEILDEKVRKWMKKKRVGISAHFRPIPNFLANAKITDSRIHPKGGWDLRPFTKNSPSTSASVKSKGHNVNIEKKL